MADKVTPNQQVIDIFAGTESEQTVSEEAGTIKTIKDEKMVILKPAKDIINGIIPIKIDNFFDLIKDMDFSTTYIRGEILYKLNHPTNGIDINNPNEWKLQQFYAISRDFYIWLKVPLFLLSYSLTFALRLILINEEELTNTHLYANKLQSIEIPSILIDNKEFNVGDRVQYDVENASFVRSGIITKISQQNGMITIRTDNGQFDQDIDDEELLLITVHKSKVSLDCIYKIFVNDLTDIKTAENDMILRNNNNKENFDIFCELIRCLDDVYLMDEWHDEYIGDYDKDDAECIPDFVGLIICQFLFTPQYNYRIHCMFDGKEMFNELQWKYNVERTIEDYKEGRDAIAAQDGWDGTGYSCDMCRVEVSYFEYMWHCKDMEHDFCLTCVHSLVQQYNQLQDYLVDILDHILSQDIILEIVSFCTGKVNKFDI